MRGRTKEKNKYNQKDINSVVLDTLRSIISTLKNQMDMAKHDHPAMLHNLELMDERVEKAQLMSGV